MIPKIIHYCWFGRNPLPESAVKCINSWKKFFPDYEIKEWNEDNFDVNMIPYTREAYEAKKYAFVSDYVRLWALEREGGLYMDVDFEVFRPFDDLMDKYPAFAGYEGSKRQPVMMGVIASEPHGAWVRDMLQTYQSREFIRVDGSLDLTPNTGYFTDRLEAQGFVADGEEKDFYVKSISNFKSQISNLEEPTFFLHVFPVHYFCPVLTTGEDVRKEETYCEHMGESSWNMNKGWKTKLMRMFSPKWKTRIIKLKRKILG
jgi:mannosyltransferase OCH1-like enzyme